MSPFGKALVVMLLTLPVVAYVMGSLTGFEADLPQQQAPVLVDDPRPAPSAGGGDQGDDRGDDDDDDDVRVVRPDPDDLDDDSGDDGDDESDDG